MESVACPLCCEDRFPNQESLKYHLLNSTMNIQCPFCEKQCDDINSLVLHLDKMCIAKYAEAKKNVKDNEMVVVYPPDNEPEPTAIDNEFDNLMKKEDYQNYEQTDIDVIKFIEEFNVDDLIKLTQTSETISEEEPHLYHQSECAINFPSIQDHRNNCHKDQENVFQVTENEDVDNILQYEANIINKQNSQSGTWIKWGNGYFFTKKKHMVLENFNENHLINNDQPIETTILKSISENIQETKDCQNVIIKNNVYEINSSLVSTNSYINHCITDAYGDRYYDVPIYLLHQIVGDVNDYLQIEARKLTFEKPIRPIRLKTNSGRFDIEQILFQNKPNNCNIIPVVERVLEWNEYIQLENMENCFFLFWKCVECNANSDHWSKLNNHKCKEDESIASKSEKINENKNPALGSNDRLVSTVRSQHNCPKESSLRVHLLAHENDSNKYQFCDQPVALEMMKTHLINHQNPELSSLKFLCKICNKCFDSEYCLRYHRKAHEMQHKPREILICDICNAKFYDKYSLKLHAVTHIKPSERLRRLHECRFCGKTFVRPIEKVNHERVHTGEKPFTCLVCGRCFRLKDLVQKHMRVHTKERPYKCRHEGCEKTFSASSTRGNHEQGHSGIEQFKCYYCPKYFKNWATRSNHVRKHMVSQKCDICDRPFVSFCNYKKHLKMHVDGVLGFKCIICRQEFESQNLLNDHLSSEHQMK